MSVSPAAVAPAPRRRAPWSEVVLLGALTAMSALSMDMYLPALPIIAQRLHATAPQVQATVTVFLVGVAAGQLVYGPLSDRIGRRPLILIGTGIYLMAGAACALAPNVPFLVAARLLQALGACAGAVLARAYVRDRYADHEVLHVFSLLSLVFGVVPVLAPLVGGLILSTVNWRWIFGVQASVALAIGASSFRILPESRSAATRLRARSERPWTSYWRLLRAPRLLGYISVGATSGAALFAYITAGPEVVISHFHVPAPVFGWAFAANAVGLVGGGQTNARLARRIRSETLLRYALSSASLAALVLLADAATGFGGLFGVLVPLFFVIASLGFSQPNAQALAMMVDRERAGTTAALMGALVFSVGGLSSVAVEALHDGTPRPMAEVILASLLLSLVLLGRSRRRAAFWAVDNDERVADPTH